MTAQQITSLSDHAQAALPPTVLDAAAAAGREAYFGAGTSKGAAFPALAQSARTAWRRVAQAVRASLLASDTGAVVITTDERGNCVAVSLQDEDLRIVKVLWERPNPSAHPADASGAGADMRAVCEALGFDPTNHHNAAKCPYCNDGRSRG